MGGTTTNTTQQAQTKGPSALAMPYWNQVLGGAQSAYNATPKTGDQIYAGPTQAQQSGLSGIENWAQGAAANPNTGAITDAMGALKQGYAPVDYTAALKASTDPFYKQLTESILPQARSADISQGAYDNPRNDITNGQLINKYWSQPVANTAAMYQQQESQAERNYAVNAAPQATALTQALQQAQLSPYEIMGAAGGQQQAWNQAQLDANAKAPWMGLPEYTQILQALDSNTTTGSGTQTQKQSTGVGDIFKGLLGAAMLFG